MGTQSTFVQELPHLLEVSSPHMGEFQLPMVLSIPCSCVMITDEGELQIDGQ